MHGWSSGTLTNYFGPKIRIPQLSALELNERALALSFECQKKGLNTDEEYQANCRARVHVCVYYITRQIFWIIGIHWVEEEEEVK